jgi:GDPmannose 4,6-dehydratase
VTSIITGITGQDAILLASRLTQNKEKVVGVTRGDSRSAFERLPQFLKNDHLKVVQCDLSCPTSSLQLIEEYKPERIFHFSAQSSVGLSFEEPHLTCVSIFNSTLNLLDALRKSSKKTRFFNSASSEVFGETPFPASASTLHSPKSPYAVAKASAAILVANYREAFSLFAVNGYMFNHESRFRSRSFVTHKLVHSAISIKSGQSNLINLGNVSVMRDWGWASEYVEAIQKMIELDNPQDLIIATGVSFSLKEFAEAVFGFFDLDFEEFYRVNDQFARPLDIHCSRACIDETLIKIDWEPRTFGRDVALRLCNELTKHA